MLRLAIDYIQRSEQKFNPLVYYKAAKFVSSYYKERRELKKTHKLRIIDLPSLLLLQRKFDESSKSLLNKHIIDQLIKEKSDSAHEFISNKSFISKASSFFSSEKSDLNAQGGKNYLKSKAIDVKSALNEKMTVDSTSKSFVKYVNLYHKSLESMVDGHREVTRNHETILDDGKSVKEKLEIFEDRIKSSKTSFNPKDK